MAENEDQYVAARLNWGRVAAAAMGVGALLLACITAVWAVARVHDLTQSTPVSLTDCVGAAALLLAACGLSLLLWGGAELLRRLADVLEWLPESAAASAGGTSSSARAADVAHERQLRLLEELVYLTREVRDIELLSESERATRLKVEVHELVQQLERDVPALLREHNVEEAHRRVQRARRRFPALPNWDALDLQIEQTRAKFEAHDLSVATREVDDLIALDAWDRATSVTRELQRRYPTAEKVAGLVRRVASGRDKATADERAHLMAQAQEASDRREWTEALTLVKTVLQRFPESAEAHELRDQLPILQSNAEIAARQEMETAIRDLIKEQRYREALRVADQLLERYPNSPQAAVLRDQLPRLRQKAAPRA